MRAWAFQTRGSNSSGVSTFILRTSLITQHHKQKSNLARSADSNSFILIFIQYYTHIQKKPFLSQWHTISHPRIFKLLLKLPVYLHNYCLESFSMYFPDVVFHEFWESISIQPLIIHTRAMLFRSARLVTSSCNQRLDETWSDNRQMLWSGVHCLIKYSRFCHVSTKVYIVACALKACNSKWNSELYCPRLKL